MATGDERTRRNQSDSNKPNQSPANDDVALASKKDGFDSLQADADLVNALMWHGFEGPLWLRFASSLAEYDMPIIAGWTLSGSIFEKCSRRGFGGLPRAPRSWDDAQELAGETVAEAIVAFRQSVLKRGKWSPQQGASLKTFFVGQCVLRFPNVYRRWLREVSRGAPPPEDVRQVIALQHRGPADPRERAELILTLEKLEDEDPRTYLVLMELGYSQAEIEARTGVPRKRIQNQLYRFRKARRAS